MKTFLYKFAVLLLVLIFTRPGHAGVTDLVNDLRYGTPEKREAAVDRIASGGYVEAAPALIEVLADTGGTLRLKVISALGEVGGKEAVKPLVALLDSPESDTRLQAARSLGRIGSKDAADALEDRLKDPDFEVRAASAEALGRSGKRKSVKKLIESLEDKHRIVRLSAVDALGYLGDPQALDDLVGMLKNEDPVLRRHVVKAVAALRGNEKINSMLGTWLKDEDPYMRGFSAEALSRRAYEGELVKDLLELLHDKVLAVRIRAVETLGSWKAREAVEPLKKFLRGNSEILRWKSAVALGRIGDPSAIAALKYTAQNDENVEVRRVAAEALDAVNARR